MSTSPPYSDVVCECCGDAVVTWLRPIDVRATPAPDAHATLCRVCANLLRAHVLETLALAPV